MGRVPVDPVKNMQSKFGKTAAQEIVLDVIFTIGVLGLTFLIAYFAFAMVF